MSMLTPNASSVISQPGIPAADHTGSGDRGVESTERLDAGGDRRVELVLVTDVGNDTDGVRPARSDRYVEIGLGGHGVGQGRYVGAHVGKDYRPPISGESSGARCADATGGAGDESDGTIGGVGGIGHFELRGLRISPACHVSRKSIDQFIHEGDSFLGGRSRRVTEHTVGCHGDHPTGEDPVLQLRPGSQVAWLRPVEPDEIGRDRQEHRRLGSPGVCVTTRKRAASDMGTAAFVPQSLVCPPQGSAVAAVRIAPDHTGEGIRRSTDLDGRLLEHGGTERQRTGKSGVLTRGADGDRWSDDRIGAPGSEALGNRDGDARVGVEGKVRAVLLGRAERHDHQRATLGHLGPGPCSKADPTPTRSGIGHSM